MRDSFYISELSQYVNRRRTDKQETLPHDQTSKKAIDHHSDNSPLQEQQIGCTRDGLFSRSEYINRICGSTIDKVQCVIFSTYGLTVSTLHDEFPLLFSETSTIRTLILHGDKREKVNDASYCRKKGIRPPPPLSTSRTLVSILQLPSSVYFERVQPQWGTYQVSTYTLVIYLCYHYH